MRFCSCAVVLVSGSSGGLVSVESSVGAGSVVSSGGVVDSVGSSGVEGSGVSSGEEDSPGPSDGVGSVVVGSVGEAEPEGSLGVEVGVSLPLSSQSSSRERVTRRGVRFSTWLSGSHSSVPSPSSGVEGSSSVASPVEGPPTVGVSAGVSSSDGSSDGFEEASSSSSSGCS